MPEWIAIAVAVIAFAIAAFAYYRSGKPLTVTGVQEAFTQSQSLAAELTEVATMAVAASEQLKESGKIKTNEAAYNNAFDHINRWFPDLDRKIVANAVEGAYNLYKISRITATTLTTSADNVDISVSETPPDNAAPHSPTLGRMG